MTPQKWGTSLEEEGDGVEDEGDGILEISKKPA